MFNQTVQLWLRSIVDGTSPVELLVERCMRLLNWRLPKNGFGDVWMGGTLDIEMMDILKPISLGNNVLWEYDESLYLSFWTCWVCSTGSKTINFINFDHLKCVSNLFLFPAFSSWNRSNPIQTHQVTGKNHYLCRQKSCSITILSHANVWKTHPNLWVHCRQVLNLTLCM